MPLLYCLSVPLIQFHSAEIRACLWSAQLAHVVVIRTSFCYGEMNSCRKDIHHRVQVSLALFKFESRGSNPLMKHPKKIWSTSVQMQSRSSKGSVVSNSCSFLLLLVFSAKDSLLRKAQHEWLSLDFILVHGHASFHSERGAERHSREKPG